MTRKNRLERKERRSRDTSLEYSTVGGMTSQAAELKSGGLSYACFTAHIAKGAAYAPPGHSYSALTFGYQGENNECIEAALRVNY